MTSTEIINYCLEKLKDRSDLCKNIEQVYDEVYGEIKRSVKCPTSS